MLALKLLKDQNQGMLLIEKPRILIATGRTGSGKTTQIGKLLERSDFGMLSGITTREPRGSDLPGEFRHLAESEFDELDPADMIFATQHGSPTRYSLLRSAVREALLDTSKYYARPLSPKSAAKVLGEFGTAAVKVIYLPTPKTEEAERRVAERGDDPGIVTARAENEADWDEVGKQTPGIYVAQGTTIEELHAEALALMELT